MSLVSERIKYTNDLLENNPDYKSQIVDLYQLMEDEITDGNSPDEEFEKFKSDVNDLITS